MLDRVRQFMARRWEVSEEGLDLRLQPLTGGLESTVNLATVETGRTPGMPPSLVIKQLAPRAREGDVYQLLWSHMDDPPAARLWGRDTALDDQLLFLERVRSRSAWPWRDVEFAAAVCREVARLHDADLPRQVFDWDYEAELQRSAEETLALVDSLAGQGAACWTRRGDLRRVVTGLPRIRRELLTHEATIIHGDVHPGNVRAGGTRQAVRVMLIDWGRARIGSPLEDVASWLHSLGCWEPEARRAHDTLLRAYLSARRTKLLFNAELRRQYWFASVSNGLAGAIRYHVWMLSNPGATSRQQRDSSRALAAWQRVVRRAAGLLSTSPSRCTTARRAATRSTT